MKKHQTTIFDIARELNISKSTVSRALTNHPNVNEHTKKLVLELAEKMDYQRNMLAISLITSKSNTIGIMVPEFRSSYFPKVVVAAQEEAALNGYHIIVSQSNESYETEVANTKVMLASQVDGLIVSITKETLNFDHLKVFQRKGIPIVFFNRVCEEMIVPKVIVNDYEGAFKAVEHLILTGKKRIAHLTGPSSLSISKKRLNGYLDALKKHDIPVDDELIISYDLSINKVNIYVKHLLSLKNPPDAIFAINDPTAIQAIQVIKQHQLKIPEDIAIIGFSDDYASALIEPSLSTMSQPIEEIGKSAIQMLVEQINRDVENWKATTKILETELIIRNSTVKNHIAKY
ncbi:LacI family DNA-binding transcriptional regulator [Pedobacter cryophilus]|uniref:LacI family transcriptional regulator n=1 Tax=Pedobacter cryophilus TaxID=2571271 RepID=A0A4U1BYX3_9SPHI|nr:LacI family DNA-binding transcriptional regulator [Pedobacter cryophilus]TKB96883.1 LacI family transcriptional regulator [Pedobacter cryophilus]